MGLSELSYPSSGHSYPSSGHFGALIRAFLSLKWPLRPHPSCETTHTVVCVRPNPADSVWSGLRDPPGEISLSAAGLSLSLFLSLSLSLPPSLPLCVCVCVCHLARAFFEEKGLEFALVLLLFLLLPLILLHPVLPSALSVEG